MRKKSHFVLHPLCFFLRSQECIALKYRANSVEPGCSHHCDVRIGLPPPSSSWNAFLLVTQGLPRLRLQLLRLPHGVQPLPHPQAGRRRWRRRRLLMRSRLRSNRDVSPLRAVKGPTTKGSHLKSYVCCQDSSSVFVFGWLRPTKGCRLRCTWRVPGFSASSPRNSDTGGLCLSGCSSGFPSEETEREGEKIDVVIERMRVSA